MSHTQSEKNEVAATECDGTSQVESDDIGVGLLAVIGAMVAVVVVLIVVLVQAWFYNFKGELLATRTAPVDMQKIPDEIAKTQRERIELRDPTTRSIPIDVAMRLVVEDLSGDASKEQGGK
jgi:hypothetical protein